MLHCTVLSENTAAAPSLDAEHGLSLYVEVNGRRVLFDMGQSPLFARNAAALAVDLQAVDTAVLSHGHYDHGGGLAAFLEQNDHAPVYVSRHAFGDHYNGTEKYIGLDQTLKGHPRLRETAKERSLGDGLTLFGELSSPPLFPLDAGGLTRREGDRFTEDAFCHEQVLLCETDGRRILLSGCAHKGIVNLLGWFRPDVFIGGCHLSKLSDEALEETVDALARFDTALYVGHCTGVRQAQRLKERLPAVTPIACGDRFTV